MIKKLLFFTILSFYYQSALAVDLTKYQHEAPIPTKSLTYFDETNAIHNLNDYVGKVVLLNFWATWCKPCIAEMPEFAKLKKDLEGRNVEIIALSVDYKGASEVVEFYKKHNITGLPVYNDDKGKAFKAFDLKALPTTVILNKEGLEIVRVLGEVSWDTKEVRDYLIEISKD